jgi:hypothetical protein
MTQHMGGWSGADCVLVVEYPSDLLAFNLKTRLRVELLQCRSIDHHEDLN